MRFIIPILLSARPAVHRGISVGSEFVNDYSKMSEDELKALRGILYNQRARLAPEAGGLVT
jgi:hypothetical protein